MNKTRMLLMAAMMAMIGATQAASPSPPQVEYSADSMIETAEVSMKGRIHYTPTRERREMLLSGGDKMLMIMRHDRKLAWTLMPSEKIYMETAIAKAQTRDELSSYKIEQTVIGPETVNGMSTTKSKIIMTGPKGEKMGGFMWTTKENIVVMMDAIAVDKKQKHRFKTELTNLKIGKQDPKLFEIPPGYEKMDMPGGMPNMQDLMKQMK